VLARPLHDATRVRKDSSVIEDQDGHLGRTTQAGDLGTVSFAGHALPKRKAIPLHGAELVLMPGRIERLRGASTRMTNSPERLLLTAGVKNHGCQPIGTAAIRRRKAGSLTGAFTPAERLIGQTARNSAPIRNCFPLRTCQDRRLIGDQEMTRVVVAEERLATVAVPSNSRGSAFTVDGIRPPSDDGLTH
jgi:hypothetical protein